MLDTIQGGLKLVIYHAQTPQWFSQNPKGRRYVNQDRKQGSQAQRGFAYRPDFEPNEDQVSSSRIEGVRKGQTYWPIPTRL